MTPTKAEYDEAKQHQADHYDEWTVPNPSDQVLAYAEVIRLYEAAEQEQIEDPENPAPEA